jgi:hypothetical protein
MPRTFPVSLLRKLTNVVINEANSHEEWSVEYKMRAIRFSESEGVLMADVSALGTREAADLYRFLRNHSFNIRFRAAYRELTPDICDQDGRNLIGEFLAEIADEILRFHGGNQCRWFYSTNPNHHEQDNDFTVLCYNVMNEQLWEGDLNRDEAAETQRLVQDHIKQFPHSSWNEEFQMAANIDLSEWPAADEDDN